jgi:hypothetical protein
MNNSIAKSPAYPAFAGIPNVRQNCFANAAIQILKLLPELRLKISTADDKSLLCVLLQAIWFGLTDDETSSAMLRLLVDFNRDPKDHHDAVEFALLLL